MDADEISRRLEVKHLLDSLAACPDSEMDRWMQERFPLFKELFKDLKEVSFYYIPKGGLVAKPVLKISMVDWSYSVVHQHWFKMLDSEEDLKRSEEKAVGNIESLRRFFDRLKLVLEGAIYYFPRNEILQTEFMKRIQQ